MKWFISEDSDPNGEYVKYTTWPLPVPADEIDGLTLAKALKVLNDMYDAEPKVIKGRGITIIIRKESGDKVDAEKIN